MCRFYNTKAGTAATIAMAKTALAALLSEAELTTGIDVPVDEAAEAEADPAAVEEPKLTEESEAAPVDDAAPLENPAGVDVKDAAEPEAKVGTAAEEKAVPVLPPAPAPAPVDEPDEPAPEPESAQPPAEVQTCPERQQPPMESVHPTSPALQQPFVAHDSPAGQQSEELGQVVKPCEEQVADEALIEPMNSL